MILMVSISLKCYDVIKSVGLFLLACFNVVMLLFKKKSGGGIQKINPDFSLT